MNIQISKTVEQNDFSAFFAKPAGDKVMLSELILQKSRMNTFLAALLRGHAWASIGR